MQLATVDQKKHLYIFFLVQLLKCKTFPVIPWEVSFLCFFVLFFFLFIFMYFTPHRITRFQNIQSKRGFVFIVLSFLFFYFFFPAFCFSALAWPSKNVCLLEHKHRRGSRPPAYSHSLQPPCLIRFIFNHPRPEPRDWRSTFYLWKQGLGEGGTGGKLEDEEKRDRRDSALYNGNEPRSRSIREIET